VTETLALVGTPVQWLVIAAVAVALFAPRLIPVIGRLLGRSVRAEVRRRYGITLGPTSSAPTLPRDAVEHTGAPAPQAPAAEVHETVETRDATLPAASSEPTAPHRSGAPIWPMTALVAGAAAVLLWVLLHAR
jgi:hypothetical protein